MRATSCLCLVLLAGGGQTATAQLPEPQQLVTVLHPAPLPPGGLVPYRKGTLWGYADTAGRVVVTPRWNFVPRLNVGGRFSLIRYYPGQPVASQADWPQMAVNARGETLLIPPGQALRLLPDSSLTLAAPGQPGVHYIQLDGNGSNINSVLPRAALPGGELPYQPRHQFESDGRTGPLGYGLQMREYQRWRRPYLNSHFEWKWYYPPGPNAVVDARNRRLTGYNYGQIFPFHNGRALVNRGGRHGYLDRRGREVIAPQFGFNTQDFRWHRAIVSDAKSPQETGNQGLIDTLGRYVIPLVQGQRLLSPALALSISTRPPLLVRQLQTPTGPRAVFLNYDGQRAFPNQVFSEALPFEQGRAWVKCQQKVGLLDEQGRFVLNCKYDELLFEAHEGIGYFGYNAQGFGGRRGLRTTTSPTRANLSGSLYPVDSQHLRARRSGRYGYVRRATGQEVIPARYDSIQWGLHQGLAFMKRAGKVYMVNLAGQELAEGSFQQEFWRGRQRYLQLTRPGHWCLVDTTGQLRLPWQPSSIEMIDFQPVGNLAIVQQARPHGNEPWQYNLLGPSGLLSTWNHSLLLFWGPTEVLGELAHATGPRYVVYDHRVRERRRLAYLTQRRLPGAGLAVLFRPDDAAAGTLVLDLVAGGVRHQLPSAWWSLQPTAPEGFRLGAGQPFAGQAFNYDHGVEGSEQHLQREKPTAAWPGLWIVLQAQTPNEQVLGYFDR